MKNISALRRDWHWWEKQIQQGLRRDVPWFLQVVKTKIWHLCSFSPLRRGCYSEFRYLLFGSWALSSPNIFIVFIFSFSLNFLSSAWSVLVKFRLVYFILDDWLAVISCNLLEWRGLIVLRISGRRVQCCWRTFLQ